ncbi:MAG: SprT-like domain-containing protein, partial [Culicoidibacterales bacterium]
CLKQLDSKFNTGAANVPCEISRRFQRTLGQYVYHPQTKQRQFRFSHQLASNPTLLHQVVIHEYIHYYLESQYQIFGHGREFRELCRYLGIPATATISLDSTQSALSRYRFYCKKCKKQLGTRHRLTKQFRQRLRSSNCRDCGGAVQVIDSGQHVAI